MGFQQKSGRRQNLFSLWYWREFELSYTEDRSKWAEVVEPAVVEVEAAKGTERSWWVVLSVHRKLYRPCLRNLLTDLNATDFSYIENPSESFIQV